jgi:hypothetical protein
VIFESWSCSLVHSSYSKAGGEVSPVADAETFFTDADRVSVFGNGHDSFE